MNKGLITALAVMFFVIVLGTYFFRNTPAPVPTTKPVSTPTEKQPDEVSSQVKEVEVIGKEFSFSPQKITVKKGDTVKLTFKNNGSFSHNFVIEALGVRTNTIGSDESQTITFKADKEGTYTYVCKVDAHEDLGMQGTLVVE